MRLIVTSLAFLYVQCILILLEELRVSKEKFIRCYNAKFYTLEEGLKNYYLSY